MVSYTGVSSFWQNFAKLCGAPAFWENVLDNYRPQRSWGKVIFSQASTILLTGGGRRVWSRGVPAASGMHPTGMHSCFSCFHIEIAYSNFTFCGAYTLSFLARHTVSEKRAHPSLQFSPMYVHIRSL